MPESHTVDSPDAAATLHAALSRFDSGARQRGAHYHRTRHVAHLARTSDTIVTATVRGTHRYTVHLLRDGSSWGDDCSCPVGGACKHVYAASLAWLDRLAIAARPITVVPFPLTAPAANSEVNAPAATALFGTRAAPLGKSAGAKAALSAAFVEKTRPLLEAKLARPLETDETAFLGKLAQLFSTLQQAEALSSHEVARLGFASREAQRGPHQQAFKDWWDRPPRDPLELWQYVAHDIESSGLPVPAFMRPLTDTAPVRLSLSTRERGEAIARWTQRFDKLLATTAHPPEAKTAARFLDLRLRLTRDKWALETRPAPAASWKPATRAFLEQLARETTQLSSLDASPAVFAFLALCQEHYRKHYTIVLAPGDAASRQLLHRLLSHRLARDLVTGPEGDPLPYSENPLVWQIEPSTEDNRDYLISLAHADAEPLSPSSIHLPGQPDLYIDDGVVYRGPPALAGLSTSTAIVPGEVIERPEVLSTLHRLGTRLPKKFDERFVSLRLRPRIEARLETDFSDNELLVVDLLAVAATPPIRHRWAPTGWQDFVDKASRTRPDDGHIHLLDHTAAESVIAQLTDFGLAYDPHDHRWTRKVAKTFADDFLAWRAALPPEVEVLATGELASLLGDPVRATIEFELLESGVHRDWFDLALALRPEDTTLTQADIALLLKARGKFVRIEGKGWRRLEVLFDEKTAGILNAAGFDSTTLGEAAAAGEHHRLHTLQLNQTGIAELLPEQQSVALRSRARELARPEPPPIPAGLNAELRAYQREGFHFLAFLSINGLGGVLADDMGLGKTLQTLTWLLWLADRQPAGEPLRALVVCPKSVVSNWESETARFAPGLSVSRFNPLFARARRNGEGHTGPLLTTVNYTQLRLHGDLFKSQKWHAIILDEGQFIKNPSAKVAKIARELPAEHRLVLTGTPIENRLLDLWSLFSFALPGLLGSQASFKRHYADDDPQALARLRTRVRHFLLRRTKSQVASDLPARTEEDIIVELEGDQERLYQAELKRARAQLLRVETDRQLDKVRFNILTSLLRLRQICCHPALVEPSLTDAPSAKLEALLEHVEELRDEGHQVLVFSQFVGMLNIIRDRLETAGIGHLLLTGQTENRDELVAQFQSDPTKTVFLLSLKAAGFGLNLTAASYVIIYDPWWNPAVEAQAIDRTHRIGQRNPVNAYRFIARGTVEEKIRRLQHDKAALANAVVQEESLANVLDLDSLREILA